MFPRRLSLLVRFSLVSAVGFVLLSVALGAYMSEQIEQRAIGNAQDKARTIALAGIEPNLPSTLEGRLTERELSRLDKLIETRRLRGVGVRRIKIFNERLLLVYSDDRRQLLRSAASSAQVQGALRGTIASKRTTGTAHDGRGEHLLEVYLPLGRVAGTTAAGVFEVYLPYAPIAAAIDHDRRRLYIAILLGALALWLTLFRLVRIASRTLRDQAQANHHQARHDALTDLPNRRMLFERAGSRLARLKPAHEAALLLIDLDHFKDVNDTLGHDQGDVLLRTVAERLRGVVRASDQLARLGGDEFAVFLTAPDTGPAAAACAQRILAVLAEPVELSSIAVSVGASIGIATTATDEAASVAQLLKSADIAMYRAKESHEHVEVYSPGADPCSHDHLALAGELNQAIVRGELVVHYQPIMDAHTGVVRGAEALVRWQHPTRGLLLPGAFLPLAERTGVIVPLTAFVIEQSVRDASHWQAAGLDVSVSCNIASASASDARLPALVGATLARWPLDPARLTLELSEDTVITDTRRVGEVLRGLHDLGVRLSLDDFGTGNSSLAHLRRLPLDQLKIDRSFVAQLADSTVDGALIDAMIALAHSLDLETVAEGVECEGTAVALAAHGCQQLQGFHFSRALPVGDFEAWMDASRATTTAQLASVATG